MRAYVLVNSALSGIQKGLQAGHALVEMAMDARTKNARSAVFNEWAVSHKTMIVLEGGYHAGLEAAKAALEAALGGKDELPWTAFYEDEETMNGMLTAVAVVVPERLWDAPRNGDMDPEVAPDLLDEVEYPTLKPWEAHVMRILAGRSLAR